jgi:hypothetical protein
MRALISTLERIRRPIDFFVRDDDAGWNDVALEKLVAIFQDAGLPIDLAAIPAAFDPATARALVDLVNRHPHIGVHQHGYCHQNHEPEGERKCEFGSTRPMNRQLADVIAGRNRLQQLMDGIALDPIFTPPWNRCSAELGASLHQHGFAMLSTDRFRNDVGTEIIQLPVMLDWERARREQRLAESFVTAINGADGPIGLMLHHGVMDDDARAELRATLDILTANPHVRFRPMRYWIGE